MSRLVRAARPSAGQVFSRGVTPGTYTTRCGYCGRKIAIDKGTEKQHHHWCNTECRQLGLAVLRSPQDDDEMLVAVAKATNNQSGLDRIAAIVAATNQNRWPR